MTAPQRITPSNGRDATVPKFADHLRHVRVVLAHGGFWALSERRLGKDMVVVCLPLFQPGPGR